MTTVAPVSRPLPIPARVRDHRELSDPDAGGYMHGPREPCSDYVAALEAGAQARLNEKPVFAAGRLGYAARWHRHANPGPAFASVLRFASIRSAIH